MVLARHGAPAQSIICSTTAHTLPRLSPNQNTSEDQLINSISN